MKKDYETELPEGIKKSLEPLDRANPLPEALSRENIANLLEAKAAEPEKAPKKAKLFIFRRAVAAVAALALLFGGGSLLKAYRELNTSYLRGDWNVADHPEEVPKDAELPENIKKPASYLEIERRFVKHLDLFGVDSFMDSLSGGLKSSLKGWANDYSWGVPESGGGVSFEAERNMLTSASAFDAAAGLPHGETNTQVEGVDEADIIKNDGEYLYIAAEKYVEKYTYTERVGGGGYYYSGYVPSVKIVKAFPAEKMAAVSEISLSDIPVPDSANGFTPSGRNIREMFLKDNMLYIIIGEDYYKNNNDEYQNRCFTSVAVYDVSDRAAPEFVKIFSQDGGYLSSRITGERLVVMSNHYVEMYGSRENLADTCVPGVFEDGVGKKIALEDILMIEDKESSTAYLVVSSVNLKNLDETPAYKSVLGGGSDSYCTPESLYVPNAVYNYSAAPSAFNSLFRSEVNMSLAGFDSYTEVFCFDISGGGIAFKNSGKVPGTPLNQFSMDEYNGYFRIATTQSTEEGQINNVFILNSSFEVVGSVIGLAKGEMIQSARFMGDTGYLVTFMRTDPLFVIDLSDPENPEVRGELKIPGFSSYLHPAGDGYLLGVGVSGDDTGATFGVKFSLFDVRDPQNPKEVDKIEIPQAYILDSSHKAFLSIPERDMYGVMIEQYSVDTLGYNTSRFGLSTFSVSGGKLERNRFFEGGYRYGDYYLGGNRGTYIGDVVYVVTGGGIIAYDIISGETLGKI